ncbi:MAG TPA: DUF1800 family protein [Solirubrobacterales bacterium]|nr:DUF1800 family protein [Solirubrobacterales bacterium]
MAIPHQKPVDARPQGRRRKRRRIWKDQHYRWVPDGQGDWRVQTYLFRHHHKPKHGHFRGPGPKPARQTGAPAAPAPAPPASDPRPLDAYQGGFGEAEATRLLQRAGFGPAPGQAAQLASLGLVGAVQSLTRPSGSAVLSGPPPRDDDGNPLAPADAWGHDHLWWLDRMVRTNQPLVERMALVFHDWFATSQANVSTTHQMIDQSSLFRSRCFGSFLDLFRAVTIDPAMLQWLNGNENYKWAPNENYAREMMELFSLGADRGAYTEDDIREQARALTGWRNDWGDAGAYNFRFEPKWHDTGSKTVFGRSGNWGWEDACRLCVEHPLHPSFFVAKLWSYFIPLAPADGVREALEATYAGSGWQIRPVLEQILMRPELYEGPPMVKPPVVQLATMLRRLGRPIDTEAWVWLCEEAGQRLYWPPNVSGWDDNRWLDTSRMRARWNMVTYALEGISVDPWSDDYDEDETPEEALARALASWSSPALRPEHREELLEMARRSENLILANWQKGPYRALRQNALLQLIGVSPDLILQ